LEKFIKRHPKSYLSMEALSEMGDLYLQLKDYPKALEWFDKVIQTYPQHPLTKKIYLASEETYRLLGKPDQAEKVLKEFVGKFPQDELWFEGYLRLGRITLGQKRFGEAISAFSTALQSREERVASEAQFRLGEAYLGAENKELALLQFAKVVYLYPHWPEWLEESLMRLGPLYLEEGKISEARQIYRKLLEKTKREDRREIAQRILNQIDKGMSRP
jgi:TolA-binding protein